MKKIPSSITLKASLENLERVNNFVHKWAKEIGLSNHSERELFLAVEEAYVNVVNYSYPKSVGKVTINCQIDEDRLILKIKDEGVPFNPLTLSKPNLTPRLEERKIGGLGVFLIRRLVDSVEYERKGKYNLLTLIKKNNPKSLSSI